MECNVSGCNEQYVYESNKLNISALNNVILKYESIVSLTIYFIHGAIIKFTSGFKLRFNIKI